MKVENLISGFVILVSGFSLSFISFIIEYFALYMLLEVVSFNKTRKIHKKSRSEPVNVLFRTRYRPVHSYYRHINSRYRPVVFRDRLIYSSYRSIHSRDRAVYSRDQIIYYRDRPFHSRDRAVYSRDRLVYSRD